MSSAVTSRLRGGGGSVRSEPASEKAAAPSEVDTLIMDMIETIHITYTDSNSPKGKTSKQILALRISFEMFFKGIKPSKELSYSEFTLEHARDLQKYVSSDLNSNEYLRFEKIVVLKEDDLGNLRSRLTELMRNEECRRVNFGVFTNLRRADVKRCFEECAKTAIRAGAKQNTSGRIWSSEINGSGRGCGVIAGDDKIYVWRDK